MKTIVLALVFLFVGFRCVYDAGGEDYIFATPFENISVFGNAKNVTISGSNSHVTIYGHVRNVTISGSFSILRCYSYETANITGIGSSIIIIAY